MTFIIYANKGWNFLSFDKNSRNTLPEECNRYDNFKNNKYEDNDNTINIKSNSKVMAVIMIKSNTSNVKPGDSKKMIGIII